LLKVDRDVNLGTYSRYKFAVLVAPGPFSQANRSNVGISAN
jgi:hypothetical protein